MGQAQFADARYAPATSTICSIIDNTGFGRRFA
jgi:hypothetical protein